MRFISISFFSNATSTTEIYTLSLHDALPISGHDPRRARDPRPSHAVRRAAAPRRRHPAQERRSEEHTSELQSLRHLVCRLMLEKKKVRRSRRDTSVPTMVAPERDTPGYGARR